jgi:hypothetical protein
MSPLDGKIILCRVMEQGVTKIRACQRQSQGGLAIWKCPGLRAVHVVKI